MKKLFLGLFACVSVCVLAVACGSNNNSSPAPAPYGANYCVNQPGTVWNGSTCVNNANCMNQPGTIWNGSTCAVNPYGATPYGYNNTSCGGGMVYTYNGCLPQGYCPIGQAQAASGCVPAMNVNGGYPNTGYPNTGYPNTYGYPTSYPQTYGYPSGYGYGYPSAYYPGYYSAPRAGLYFYGHF